MFLTSIVLSNPAINPQEVSEIYDLNWKINNTRGYKPNGNGEVLRYKLFKPNSNMYKYGYQPTIDASTGEKTYDANELRYKDLSRYAAGTEYLGRTNDSEGSFVYVINEAQDHYTLHNFGTGDEKVKSPLKVNEVAIQNTMADENYQADADQVDENKIQANGVPVNVYVDDNWLNESFPLIARTVDCPYHTARVFECIETHKGAQKLLGYEVEMIIRDGGKSYKADDEVIVRYDFIEQRIKITSVDGEGAITGFELIGIKESGADIEKIDGTKFFCNRNIDNTFGDSTAFVNYGTTYPAGHEFDEFKDEVISGSGATFNYDCKAVYEDDQLAFYDPQEFNRWAYVRDITVYCVDDVVIAEDLIDGYTEPTLNKYVCTNEVVPLNEWAETVDSFELVSKVGDEVAPYDLLWVKANDLITDGTSLASGSTYYINNASDTSYQYLITNENPNEMEVVPQGATATAFSQMRVELDGDLWLKIPFGHFIVINVETIN